MGGDDDTAAPPARSAVAWVRMVSASGATVSPPTFAAMVAVSAPRVMTPDDADTNPAASTIVDGWTLGQRDRRGRSRRR